MLRVHGMHSDQFSAVETRDTDQTKKLQRLVLKLILIIQSKTEDFYKIYEGGGSYKNMIVFPIEAHSAFKLSYAYFGNFL